MDKQKSLSGLSDELSQVRTKKKEFLSQIEPVSYTHLTLPTILRV